MKISFFIILIIDILIVFIPNNVLFLLISPELFELENGYNTFIIIFYGVSLLVFSNIVSVIFMITKQTKKLIVAWLLGAIINLFGNLFIEDFGMVAAAIATFTAYLCVVLFSLYYSKGLVREYIKK
jgi:O-antigen/teichoic acid export membrane protein